MRNRLTKTGRPVELDRQLRALVNDRSATVANELFVAAQPRDGFSGFGAAVRTGDIDLKRRRWLGPHLKLSQVIDEPAGKFEHRVASPIWVR